MNAFEFVDGKNSLCRWHNGIKTALCERRHFFFLAVVVYPMATIAFGETEETSFRTDFEAPNYKIGTIDGQAGWKVDQGTAEIREGEGLFGSYGLMLLPEDPFSQVRLELDTPVGSSRILFLDVHVRPVSSAEDKKEEMIDINSARIGVFADPTTKAAFIWVFDGDLNGGGTWVRTAAQVAIDQESRRAAGWHRLTVRQDVEGQFWDLWVDGKWAAAGVGLQEAQSPRSGSTYIFMGDAVSPLSLDDVWIGVVPPPEAELPPPPEDATAEALDSIESRDTRARLAAEGNKDTDGDGMSDRNERLLGLDPLVANDVKAYVPSPTTEVFTRIQIPLVKRGLVLENPFPDAKDAAPREAGNKK